MPRLRKPDSELTPKQLYHRRWRDARLARMMPEEKAVFKKMDAERNRARRSTLSSETKVKYRNIRQERRLTSIPPSVLGAHYPQLGTEFFQQHPDIAEQFRKKIRLGRKIKQLSKNEQNP